MFSINSFAESACHIWYHALKFLDSSDEQVRIKSHNPVNQKNVSCFAHNVLPINAISFNHQVIKLAFVLASYHSHVMIPLAIAMAFFIEEYISAQITSV